MAQINLKKTIQSEVENPSSDKLAIFVDENNDLKLKNNSGDLLPLSPLLEVRVADIEEKLNPDFLLVDIWIDDDGNNGIGSNAIGVVKSYLTEGKYSIIRNDVDGVVVEIIAGDGSNPFVPISQTTIFVHPTTFERYKFNGTTMEIYNDVNGIVPKWLKYEALLTQSGENAPVARVLNQDDVDFFNIDFSSFIRATEGFYYNSQLIFDRFTTTVNLSNSSCSTGLAVSAGIDTQGLLCINNWYVSGNGAQGGDSIMFYPHHLEVKKRLRGAPPKLLLAETNETGDKVILTFDKKMNSFDRFNSNDNIFTININEGSEGISVEQLLVKDNKITISLMYSTIANGDVLFGDTQGYSDRVESLDLGIFGRNDNFPVINNVVE